MGVVAPDAERGCSSASTSEAANFFEVLGRTQKKFGFNNPHHDPLLIERESSLAVYSGSVRASEGAESAESGARMRPTLSVMARSEQRKNGGNIFSFCERREPQVAKSEAQRYLHRYR